MRPSQPYLAEYCGMFVKIGLILAAILMPIGAPLFAQLAWEDYQGNSRVNSLRSGPYYSNNSGTSAQRINALRTISANPSNAVRTGNSANINYVATPPTMCNADSDTTDSTTACQLDAMGRVIYGVLRLPYSGNYSFSLAHDDDIDLDFSTAYASSNYRTASYDVPIGTATAWTVNDTTYENLTGTVNAPSANSCVLIRLYWNNAGGINHLRLRWTRPVSNGSGATTTEIIPASQFMAPGTTTNCTGSVSTTSRSLTLNKLIGSTGRASANDQFTIAVLDSAGATELASASTSGSETGQQASTGAMFVTAGVTYRLTDTMASGSGFTLAAYTSSINCLLNGSNYSASNVSAGVWTITVPATGTNQQFVCNITNSRASRQIQLRKSWSGANVGDAVTIPPTTGFSTNSSEFNAVANIATEIDNGAVFTVLTGTGTLTGETFTSGIASRYRSILSCSDGTLAGTDGKVGGQLTIGATGATIVCTYANTYLPPPTVTKASFPYSDPVNGTTNPKMIPGALVDYTITVTSAAGYTADTNSIYVIDPLPGQVELFVNSIGGSPAGPMSFTAGSSGLTFTYAGLSSLTDDLDFSNNGGTTWTYVPTPDANGIDSAITHIRVNPKGSMAAITTFVLRFRTRIE